MKNTRRILCIVMVCLVCMSAFLLPVSAKVELPDNTVGYGMLDGSTDQDDIVLTSTVQVEVNTDNAYLRVRVETQDETGTKKNGQTGTSDRGATYLEDELVMIIALGTLPPVIGFGAYEVYGGHTYDAYVKYKTFDVDSDVF